MPEWSGSGLQNRVHGFDSRRRLHILSVKPALNSWIEICPYGGAICRVNASSAISLRLHGDERISERESAEPKGRGSDTLTVRPSDGGCVQLRCRRLARPVHLTPYKGNE